MHQIEYHLVLELYDSSQPINPTQLHDSVLPKLAPIR